MEQNFCSLAVGTLEERSTWLYQAKKLLSLCSLILAECDFSRRESDNMVALTALAMRLVISLTDLNGWKCLKSENTGDADVAVKRLIGFMSTRSSGMYSCIRRFVLKLGAQDASQRKAIALTDDQFLITASAVTLGLRPFHLKKSNINDADAFDVNGAIEEYILFILTVPYLCQRLPSFLLPALKHESVLLPSLNILLVRTIMLEYS